MGLVEFQNAKTGKKKEKKTMGPYDSIRDYIADLEEEGRLTRISKMDQDAYEATAFLYELMDRMGSGAPCVLIEEIKVKGKWHNTPVIGNVFNGFDMLALCFGVEPAHRDNAETYSKLVQKICESLDTDLHLPSIEPLKVDGNNAPCKEIRKEGEEIDLFEFPWIQNNPGDGGQYISTGVFVLDDEELGPNAAIHRAQVKGPSKIGANFAPGSHSHQYMMRAKRRGEEKVHAALAMGIDPISWILSGSRLAGLGQDEFTIAGGFRGRPLELVKCESNDLFVPASTEIVLEGDIINAHEPEGPYGELHGYMGNETETFYMDVKVMTHREVPWIWNFWPGIEHNYLGVPWNALHYKHLKKVLPNLVKLYTPPEAPTVVIAGIDKSFPGQGTEAGLLLMGYRPVGFTKKVVVIVDKDVDPTNLSKVVHAMGTNWQPVPASLPIANTYHTPVDPSLREPFMSSKMVIDATRQLPGEGGPKAYPDTNRGILEREAPESFELVREKWDSFINKIPIL